LFSACDALPPQSFDDIDLPADFRLDTSHDVAFTVRGDVFGQVEVTLPDGTPLLGGDAQSVARTPAVLHVPYGTRTLSVSLRATDGSEHTVSVPVVDGVATWGLGGAR